MPICPYRLLSVDEAAVYLNTSPRFVRRLVSERRIRVHRLGRHVRLAESDLADFIQAGTVSADGSA